MTMPPAKRFRQASSDSAGLIEKKCLQHLPDTQAYEVSYAHRDIVTSMCLSNAHDMLLTGSVDGVVKFWKRSGSGGLVSDRDSKAQITLGVEFVKSYQAHFSGHNPEGSSLSGVLCLKLNRQENMAASIGSDCVIKLYDVANFDVSSYINAKDVDESTQFSPHCCFIGTRQSNIAVGTISGAVLVFDTIELQYVTTVTLHARCIVAMEYNFKYGTIVSGDASGVIEVWQGDDESGYPIGSSPIDDKKRCGISWSSKMSTDLYIIMKNKAKIASLSISSNGEKFAIFDNKRNVNLFKYSTGRILSTFDESVESYDPTKLKMVDDSLISTDALPVIDSFEYGKRCAVEAEMDDSNLFLGGDTTNKAVLAKSQQLLRMEFSNEEGNRLLLVPSVSGLVVFDTETKKRVKTIGTDDANQIRILGVCIGDSNFQLDQQAILAKDPSASNLAINHDDKGKLDPLIVAYCWNKKRVYLFSNYEASLVERDILNEPPEDDLVGNMDEGPVKLASAAIVRTTMGDIKIKLFPEVTPKTVENFVTHARNGYYDNVIFHRVIKGFMVQTGDPLGDGTGGESIWGGEFDCEINTKLLRHDRPFTLSMANAGPNTNGSQFFITTVPTPWLDSKHTVFGRVTVGMDVVTSIENSKVDSDTDRPLEEMSIISIDVEGDLN